MKPAAREEVPTEPCALARRDGCAGRTRGIDPCRVCDACQARGEPPRVDYAAVVGRAELVPVIRAGVLQADDPKGAVGAFASFFVELDPPGGG